MSARSLRAAAEKRKRQEEDDDQVDVKLVKIDYSDIITVVVGAAVSGVAKQEFKVHRGVMCAKSPFFEAACKKETFAEGEKGIVPLPEADPVAFDLFANWAYTNQVDMERVKQPWSRLNVLAKAWMLADFLGSSDFGNVIIGECRKNVNGHDCCPSPEIFNFIPRKSKIWWVYIELLVTHVPDELFGRKNVEQRFSKECLFDVFEFYACKW